MLRGRQQESGGEEVSELPPDAQSALINWVEQGNCAGSIIGTGFEERSDPFTLIYIRNGLTAD